MIEYDGYLDRSRLGAVLMQKDLYIQKDSFQIFKEVLLKNKKEGLNSLAINYQFTHEYKKMEFNDEMNSEIFGEVYDEDQTVSDQSRFVEQENKVILSSDLNKLGLFNLSYSITNWKNNFKIYNEDDLINSIDEDQSNVSINWYKKSNKFNFEFIFNKSSKDDFKSDYISFKINGSPIRNFDFQLSLFNN